MYEASLFVDADGGPRRTIAPLKTQFLKWIGNKQRFAHEIASYFPPTISTYFEPFLGSGAVLGTLAPERAIASDVCEPLIGIWQALADDPKRLLRAYRARWERFQADREETYESVKASFNKSPNWEDLLFLSRSCYGGVVRFRKDGYMSTPIGVHNPIAPESLAARVDLWRRRTAGATFKRCGFEEAMDDARKGDVIYCDPPYADTQTILYGAQGFSLRALYEAIDRAKRRGAFVVLSIDGKKKSGSKVCDVGLPEGLFERTVYVHCGRSMLRRFQMVGETLEAEVVSDRLLLTW